MWDWLGWFDMDGLVGWLVDWSDRDVMVQEVCSHVVMGRGFGYSSRAPGTLIIKPVTRSKSLYLYDYRWLHFINYVPLRSSMIWCIVFTFLKNRLICFSLHLWSTTVVVLAGRCSVVSKAVIIKVDLLDTLLQDVDHVTERT